MGSDATWMSKDGMYLRDAIGGEITDADEGTRQVQVTFPHDTVDTFKTTFDKDAFRESFASRMPLMCWQHDLRDPIGHAVRADVTPKSNELIGQFDDFDAVPNAKRAFSQIQSKTITDFSFGFRQPKYEPHRSKSGVRNIRSAIMMEFSPVSIGSIPGAVATGLREEDIEMAEATLSATEIIAAVQAGLMDPEEGKRALAELDGFRNHITIRTPDQIRIAALEADIASMRSGTAVTNITGTTLETTELIAAPGMEELRGQIASLETALAAAQETRSAVAIPEVINAEALMTALPDDWRRALDGAAIAVAPAGTKFFKDSDQAELEENLRTIAGAIEAATTKAAEWTADLKRDDLPEGAVQALNLYEAAGTSADALLTVLGVPEDQRARKLPTAADGTAVSQTQAEDMEPTAVKCGLCNGSGEGADGKTCERCMGSGVEALSRDDMPEGAPQHASKCPTCQGKGTRPEMNGSCPSCRGKGWLDKDDAAEMNTRADTGSFSEAPWNFTQADYSPEQWKAACLVRGGDDKADNKLPIKEPNGTINVNGIAAAAGRLNQLDVSSEERASAANHLKDLYQRMRKDVPAEVEKLSTRAVVESVDGHQASDEPIRDEESAEAAKQALEAKLNKVAREPASAKVKTTKKAQTGEHVVTE